MRHLARSSYWPRRKDRDNAKQPNELYTTIWYTLIESCRRRKVDPWKYLTRDRIAPNTFRRHVKRFDLLKPES